MNLKIDYLGYDIMGTVDTNGNVYYIVVNQYGEYFSQAYDMLIKAKKAIVDDIVSHLC